MRHGMPRPALHSFGSLRLRRRALRGTIGRTWISLSLLIAAGGLRSEVALASPPLQVREPAQPPSESTPTVVIKSQHRRLTFPLDIRRIAVGNTEILSAELISSR